MILKRKIYFFFLILVVPFCDFLVTKIFNFYASYKDNQIINQEKIRVPHNYYHHGFKKNSVSIEKTGPGNYWKIFTNELGFKSKKNSIVHLNSDNNILFLGDSVTEGVYLPYEKTFVGIFENKFTNYNILNGGRGSYSPILYLKKLEYLIENEKLNIDKLLIFLDNSDIQDEAVVYKNIQEEAVVFKDLNLTKTKEKNADELPLDRNKTIEKIINVPNLKQNSSFFELESLKRILRENLLATYTLLKLFKNENMINFSKWDNYLSEDFKRFRWSFDDKVYEEFGKDGIKFSKINLRKINEITKKKDIELFLAVYPEPNQIILNDFKNIHYTTWKQFAEENDIIFLDLYTIFFDEIIKSNNKIETSKKIIKKYYFLGDNHFNQNGNIFLAENLIKYFNKYLENVVDG